MAIPTTPNNFLVSPGNGQVYLAWNSVLGSTSASTGVPVSSTGQYDVLRSLDNLNFSLVTSINSNSYYDIAGVPGGPSTAIVYYYAVRANGNSGQSTQTASVATTVVNPGQTTLGAVRLAAQQRADLINNEFITTQEWNDYINHSYYELYDILVQVYGDEYFVAVPYTFTTDGRVPGLYSLPINMYKLMGVDLSLNSSDNSAWISLKKFTFLSRNRYIYANTNANALGFPQPGYRLIGNQIDFIPPSQSNQQMRLWYIPRAVLLQSDSDVLDGISGWDEYVIVDAAIKAMQKEESDVSVLMAQKQALLKRIESASSNRDVGQPEGVTDIRRLEGGWFDGDGPLGGGW